MLIGVLAVADFFPSAFYLFLVSLTCLKRNESSNQILSMCSFLYVLAILHLFYCSSAFYYVRTSHERLIVILKCLGLSEGYLDPFLSK